MSVDDLLRRQEDKTLEFKRDLSSPRGVLRALVAFANSAGGRLVLGVEAATREVVGVDKPLLVSERLSNLVADSIEPRLLVDIDLLPWRRSQLIQIEVHPSALRPHFIKSEGPEQGTYVRLGSTNRRADGPLIAELRRRPETRAHDEEPMANLDSDAIDFAALTECFASVRTLRRQDLVTLGIVTAVQKRRVPTVGGIVLFGRERRAHFPDAWIQAGRFLGTDKSVIADQTEIRDYPVHAVETAVRFVERNTQRSAEIGSVRRRDVPAVPPAALREALVNAVVHTDYTQRGAPIRVAIFDDRIEIENPGILLPGLTVEEIREGVSRLRNPVIGRVFNELGLIEQWGSGVQRMTAACLAAGLPAPELVELGLRFRVTLRTVVVGPVVFDEIDRRLLEYLDSPQGRSTQQLSAHLEMTPRAIQKRLARLADSGLVVVVGSGPRDPRRRWFIARHAEDRTTGSP